MLVTIDTNLMIWGIQQVASQGQEHKIQPAVRFLKSLDENNDQVAITAQALAEYLTPIEDEEEREAELSTISSRFMILPFDVLAAKIAAELRRDKAFINQLSEDEKRSKICIKSDIAIVATSLACNVQRIYADDKGVRAVAKRAGLPAMGIPSDIQKELDSSDE